MARHSSLLSSCTPNKVSAAEVTIGHVQLRDLVICPQEPGILNYVQNTSIVEHDLHAPDLPPRTIADLTFIPNTLASLHVPGTDKTLLAAGGQEAEIHLSLHNRSERREDNPSRPHSLTRSNESSVEPRLVVSNNDWKVKFYDVPVCEDSAPKEIRPCGLLRLEEPVNHSSISPDGRTLLSVGDSPRIYLHQLTGGARVTFNPIATLNVPPPDTQLYSAALAASFSTAFSADGMKFAVASQEGVVAVWDVRSTKPMKVIQTDKTRSPTGQHGNGESSGWLSDDPNDWTRWGSRAPWMGGPKCQVRLGWHEWPPRKRVNDVHRVPFHLSHGRHRLSIQIFCTFSMLEPLNRKKSCAFLGFPGGKQCPPGRYLALLRTWIRDRNDILFRPHTRHCPNSRYGEDSTAWCSENRRARPLTMEMVTVVPEDVEMEVDEMEGDCVSSRGPSRSSSPPPSVHLPVQPSPSPTRSTWSCTTFISFSSEDHHQR
ncbi:hypothetical protein EDC04DRAFT_3088512 [Pisolithus marmoratus]|nr:hypothetical protein EDC04DRAFT_3088512 [Pisolithus marmoratus]